MTNPTKETEVTIYAKIGDMNGFNAAVSSETHVQISSKFEKGARCRVRKTTTASETKYVFTVKKRPLKALGAVFADDEYNTDVSEDFFETFLAAGAEEMCHKTRYIFNPKNVSLKIFDGETKKEFKITVPVMKYEVDVFIKKNGTISDWCKIDIELDSVQNYLKQHHPEVKKFKTNFRISALPFKPEGGIVAGAKNSDQNFIDQLWKTDFSIDLSKVHQ